MVLFQPQKEKRWTLRKDDPKQLTEIRNPYMLSDIHLSPNIWLTIQVINILIQFFMVLLFLFLYFFLIRG